MTGPPGRATTLPLRLTHPKPLCGQWRGGVYQLKRADQVDLVRHDLPLDASETTGSG